VLRVVPMPLNTLHQGAYDPSFESRLHVRQQWSPGQLGEDTAQFNGLGVPLWGRQRNKRAVYAQVAISEFALWSGIVCFVFASGAGHPQEGPELCCHSMHV